MKTILIIGKKSFIGSSLKKYLSKHFDITILSYESSIKKKISFFNNFTHVINTSIHRNYIKKKYNDEYDFDKKIIQKFSKINFIYIYLNTRKIYFQKENITENSRLNPSKFYEKNKLLTEKFLKKKLKKNFLSLRIGNLIGQRMFKSRRNHHKLFFDNFLKLRRSKKKIIIEDDFKDFLSIKQFCEILRLLILKKIVGIYNVSLSEKVYISEITKWLDYDVYKRINFIKKNNDSFTLSNKKLINKIKRKPLKKDLRLFCENFF